MTKRGRIKDRARISWRATWGIAALLLIMVLAPATTAAYDVDGRIQNEMELAEGTVNGIVCGGKQFKKASEIKGSNFNAWVYVEEPSLIQQLDELVHVNSREVRIGWHWDTPMTKDALTLRYTIVEKNSGEVHGPFYHVTEATITDQCGGVTESVLVGGQGARSVEIHLQWTFSGAQKTVTDTEGHVASTELWAEAAYKWEVSAEVSATGPRAGASMGGSVAYGGAVALQISNTSSVTLKTITKTAIGSVWIGPGPVILQGIIPDVVVVDKTAIVLCVLAHNVEGGSLEADFCKPVDFESHFETCADEVIDCIPDVPNPCDNSVDPCGDPNAPDPCELPGDPCGDPEVPHPCELPGDPCGDPEIPHPCDFSLSICDVDIRKLINQLIDQLCNDVQENPLLGFEDDPCKLGPPGISPRFEILSVGPFRISDPPAVM